MSEELFGLLRKGVWAGGGLVVVGFLLTIRFWVTKAPPSGPIVPTIGWCTLALGVMLLASAVETGRPDLEFWLVAAGCVASMVGALTYAIAFMVSRNSGGVFSVDRLFEILERGPGLTLLGFVAGGLCNGSLLWTAVAERRSAAETVDADEEAKQVPKKGPSPKKRCSSCGKSVAAYAAACKHCKAIFGAPEAGSSG